MKAVFHWCPNHPDGADVYDGAEGDCPHVHYTLAKRRRVPGAEAGK